jgi:hypothetical protein
MQLYWMRNKGYTINCHILPHSKHFQQASSMQAYQNKLNRLKQAEQSKAAIVLLYSLNISRKQWNYMEQANSMQAKRNKLIFIFSISGTQSIQSRARDK